MKHQAYFFEETSHCNSRLLKSKYKVYYFPAWGFSHETWDAIPNKCHLPHSGATQHN